MRLLAATLLVLAGTVTADITYDIDLLQHLEKLADNRYPTEDNSANRANTRDYIRDRFRNYGLDVMQQKFNTTVNKDKYGLSMDLMQVEGTNVIGVVPAVTKHPGAVVVVGADYDSNGIVDPMFHNGGGVAALLEVARLYFFNKAWSGRFAVNFTTVFVAFDINTKLHENSPGTPGGRFFVRDWLWPMLGRNATYFGGAVILDSVMNVDYEINSQVLTSGFNELFPDTYKRVQESGAKGDFLSMVSWGNADASITLKDQFKGSYNKDRKMRRFRLEDMKLHDGVFLDDFVKQVVRSENIHFWRFIDDKNATIQLPALLLTDTASLRRSPIDNCDKCRPVDLLTEERIEFLEATVKATTDFLFNRQATLLPEVSGSKAAFIPSMLMTTLMLCLVRLYM